MEGERIAAEAQDAQIEDKMSRMMIIYHPDKYSVAAYQLLTLLL